ncbi:protease II [Algibacter lectus]|uniref:Protease II n=1 Tax=Algibacter lectus TaxID=221126 RepID=A0A090VGM1_9FLAO|nr:protease II [Algibacter lectus]
MKIATILLSVSFTFAASCKNINMSKSINEVAIPSAKKISKTLEIHNDVRIDNYYWLNDRENPEVIDYLNVENNYTKALMAHTEGFQKDLFEEMKGRIKEDDSSLPYKLNGYWYITRYETGKDYPIYLRKKGSLDAEEEILFDCNEMAKDQSYFSLGGISISQITKWQLFLQIQ